MEQTEQKVKSVCFTHQHSNRSLFDGISSIDAMVAYEKELGATSISLTDHGTLMGIDDFMAAGKKYGVNTVPGCELYVKTNERGVRLHLIVYSIDNQGYHQVMLCVTESNKDVNVVGKSYFPMVTEEMLDKYFGKGSEGYGHVYITSACISGVIAGLNFKNNADIKSREQILEKLKKIKAFEEHDKKTEEQAMIVKQLSALSKKKFDKKIQTAQKNLDKNPESTKYQELLNQLLCEKKKSDDAAASLPEERTKSATMTDQNKILKKACTSVLTKSELEAALKLATNLSEEELKDEMMKAANKYNTLFGQGHFFIEVQYHGLEEEAKWMPYLAEIANFLGIPLIAANDAHMIKKEDADTRMAVETMRYDVKTLKAAFREASDIDKEMYIKTSDEIAEWLNKILKPEQTKEAIENMNILDNCHVKLEPGNYYPTFPTPDGMTADELLEKEAREGIKWRYPVASDWTEVHEKRLVYELQVIKKMGYADYHLIVRDFLDIGRKIGCMPQFRFDYLEMHCREMSFEEMMQYILEDQSGIGLPVGPGRGSAAGSLVCYNIGITSIDPIKLDLLFERFLNVERDSMPDIDSDFAPRVRPIVIEYVRKKYGYDRVCQILTKNVMGPKGAVRYAAKIVAIREMKSNGGNEETTLYRDVVALGDRIAKNVPKKPGTSFHDNSNIIGCLPALRKQFDDVPYGKKILDLAETLEGSITSNGMHAAGVVISDNEEIKQHIPLMWDTRNKLWKCQSEKDSVEEKGLLKMDFLGLRNLGIISAIVVSAKNRGIYDVTLNLENLPIEHDVIKKIYANGNMMAIFQTESPGMQDVMMRMSPDTLLDIILGIAGYRPGPMQFLCYDAEHPDSVQVIDVKNGKAKVIYGSGIPEKTQYDDGIKRYYCLKEIEPIVSPTYGAIIYQEQVMQICQVCAGYTLGRADIVRRYMSKKKYAKLEHEKNNFVFGNKKEYESGAEKVYIPGCIANGISQEAAELLFEQMLQFAAYAFNKSHAAAYAYVSYITAYLKYHYPVDFWCGVLQFTPFKKYQAMISAMKKEGVSIHIPDVNASEVDFSIKEYDGRDTILFGLSSIKGMQSKDAIAIVEEREKNGKYLNISDFIIRTGVSIAIIDKLTKAGALDSISKTRNGANATAASICAMVSNVKKHEKEIMVINAELEILPTVKTIEEFTKKCKKRGINITRKTLPVEKQLLEQLAVKKEVYADDVSTMKSFEDYPDGLFEDDSFQKMVDERKVIGLFITGHPLDGRSAPKGCVDIETATKMEETKKKQKFFGIITDIKYLTTKKGLPMMAFNLEDQNEVIETVCYPRDFEEIMKKSPNIIECGTYIVTASVIQEEVFMSKAELEEMEAAGELTGDEENEEDEICRTVNKLIVSDISICKPELKEILVRCDLYSKQDMQEISNLVEDSETVDTDSTACKMKLYDIGFNETVETSAIVKRDIIVASGRVIC